MLETLFTTTDEFEKIIIKIKSKGKEIDNEKTKQFNALSKITNAINFESTFNRYNLRIKELYRDFENKVKTAIEDVDLNYDQGDNVLKVAQKFYDQWNKRLDDLKELINHIHTKIVFFDKKPDLIKLVSTNQNDLERFIAEIKKSWIKVGDKKVIEKIINAFIKKQFVNNKLPYDKSENLWKEGQIVTAKELGIQIPNIPEVNSVNFEYTIIKVDLDRTLVEVQVAVIKGNGGSYQKQFVNVEIFGFVDYTKFDHVKLIEFISHFKDKQTTKHLDKTIFSWKIDQKEGVDKDFLGIEEPENEINAKLEYTIKKIDFNQGVVNVQLDAYKHDIIMTHHIEISGFYIGFQVIEIVKQDLDSLSSSNYEIDLQQKLTVKDEWSAVIPYIKEQMEKDKSTNILEIINNLAFFGEALSCNDIHEKIIDHIDLDQKVIKKTFRIYLANLKIGKYTFRFKNHFDSFEIHKQAVEEFANEFHLSQNTKLPKTTAPFEWNDNDSKGINSGLLGITEPKNKINAKIVYEILSKDYEIGQVKVTANISVANYSTKRTITIHNFTEVKRIFNKLKGDLKKFETSDNIINFHREVTIHQQWKSFFNQIIFKLLDFEPFKSYGNDKKYVAMLHILGDVKHNQWVGESSEYNPEKTPQNFDFWLGNANLGYFTFNFHGFKGAKEFVYQFKEIDKNGNVVKDIEGEIQKPSIYLETGATNDNNSISKTFVIFEDFSKIADSWDDFLKIYQLIEMKDMHLKIKWHKENVDQDIKEDKLWIKTPEFKLGKPVTLFSDGYRTFFAEQHDNITVTLDINRFKQLTATFTISADSKIDVYWIYTTLTLGKWKFIPSEE